jgi:hypothetical protein
MIDLKHKKLIKVLIFEFIEYFLPKSSKHLLFINNLFAINLNFFLSFFVELMVKI